MFLLVNFGGPRNLKEIPIFLRTLLTDEDVIRPTLIQPFHKLLFTYIARKRAKTLCKDYEEIGGKSPIFDETEDLAKILEEKLNTPFLPFHRYLPETHKKTLSIIEHTSYEQIFVLPMFPQFSYATTGSCARFFQERLSQASLNKLRWIKSYPSHVKFVKLWQNQISEFLQQHGVCETEAFFLFSAHGLPKRYIDEGDPYEIECKATMSKIMEAFPNTSFQLAFQSQFGKEQWNEPYTKTICSDICKYNEGKKHIFFIPISFTSDHIETLFEIEKIYMPMVSRQGLNVYRVPACYSHPSFPDVLCSIVDDFMPTHTSMLVRAT